MKRMLSMMAAGIVLAAVSSIASAHGHVGFSISLGVPLPGVSYYPAAPPMIYAPPPVVYTPPPVVYTPPPVMYAPAPVYYGPPVYRYYYGPPRPHRYWHRRW